MLVTSYEGFDHYQCKQAKTWEHLALLRARAIAGSVETAQKVLDRVRRTVIGEGIDTWTYLADLRARVQSERGKQSGVAIPIKTGRGGLMDLDFLAGGGVLECGADSLPELPSIPAMLRSVARGERVDALLSDYLTLRIVEARSRWLRAHSIEGLATESESLGVVAELFEPGLAPPALLERIESVRERVRAAYDAVMSAGTIRAISGESERTGDAGGPGIR
jgi:glutamate-ammonia-ligase adenylyltransferase